MSHTYDCNSKQTYNPEDCDCGEIIFEDKEDELEDELFFICPSCGKLTTQTERNKDYAIGGLGLCDCDCEYMKLEWDEKIQDFQPVYYRIYHDYTQIPESLYKKLEEQKNTALRLEMLWTM